MKNGAKINHVNETGESLLRGIKSLYMENGFIDAAGHAKTLHEVCHHSGDCYCGSEDRKQTSDDYKSLIMLPWIGNRYTNSENGKKILVLGINPNENGGLEKTEIVVKKVKEELRGGKRKALKDEGYSGSLMWHRVACYYNCLDAALQNKIMREQDPLFSPKELENAYDSLTFINHIKCSLKGSRSSPTRNMWVNCYQEFLQEEIRILDPDWIIVLGYYNGDNLYQKLKTDASEYEKNGVVRFFTTDKLCGKRTSILVVPHPALPIGLKIEYPSMLYEKAREIIDRTI